MAIDSPSSAAEPIRVMLVDDSAVVRGLVTRILEGEAGIQVVASVGNGQMALASLERNEIDVVILDIEMPVMDGLTALPKLLQIDPGLKVIMQSTLTLKGADVSLRAMQMGAADYIPKPTSTRDLAGGADFKSELVGKIRALGQARRAGARPARPGGPPATRPTISPSTPRTPVPIHPPGPLQLRSNTPEPPDVIAIGSSTGGPQALFTVLGTMKAGTVRQPILITQHMPATFTTILAEHISRVSGWNAHEAVDGEVITSGRVYIAPGDFHMVVETKGTDKVLRLNKNPPENFCRPAVDPMLRSIAAAYGKRVLTCILTGMGADGMKGGQAVVASGGTVIAQDEASSVVWGMPGAAATAGICSAVLPLPEIAPWIMKLAARR
ncbi:Chemotaxis response regulator protein-glutamate methylesterase 1(CheY-like superfamily,10-125;Signal transduction response regulator, chemotaxis, protein-glutamate methylesterase,187-380) [Magnetospirillum sp. XM-1]|uniref:protein-glutamate methylesterase/protein-glutamine glutaminase n=1 Tax=Magnetospirillum sp. XM-1 TaxID=1663591 RepID=UPI00073DE17C|nr:chemotaxis response regulator protein-glutamate methylesterase [Magnetospirillum sp. XM-1]CUW38320.1 Chemotaxis response regulator protein-glutamate methylesterase 1(CheY-like superfamily,10-125;Signal transduction response regulator, chemotaxis, protein-glutamate methylesterase,187-380) [Magnetospirillum sp. XM-1]